MHPAGRQALVAALLLSGRSWQDSVDLVGLSDRERLVLRQRIRVDDLGRLTFHGTQAAGHLVATVLAELLRSGKRIRKAAATPKKPDAPRRAYRRRSQVLADFEATRDQHGGYVHTAATVMGISPRILRHHLTTATRDGHPVVFADLPRKARS